MRLAVLVTAATCVLSTGCAVTKSVFQARVRECEGFDVPLATLAGSSRKELRVRVVARRVNSDFPFVVESDADSFVLIGFTPLGTKAFTLVRNVDDVSVENLIGPAQVVPPENIMADVLAMSVPSTCAATPDEIAVLAAGTWQIRDTCKDGRPLERNVTKTGTAPDSKPALTVLYGDDAITVRQNACRYVSRYVLQATPAPQATTPLVPFRIKAAPKPRAPVTPATAAPAPATPGAPAPAAPAPVTSGAPAAPAPVIPAAPVTAPVVPASPVVPAVPPAPAPAQAAPPAAESPAAPVPAEAAAPDSYKPPKRRSLFGRTGEPAATPAPASPEASPQTSPPPSPAPAAPPPEAEPAPTGAPAPAPSPAPPATSAGEESDRPR